MSANKLTASLRLQLINDVSGEAKAIEGSLGRVDASLRRFGKGGAAGVDLLSKKMEALRRQERAYADFRKAEDRRYMAGGRFNKAKTEIESLAKAMREADKPTIGQQSKMFWMRKEVSLAAAALREETAAARGAKSALEQLAGVGAGKLAANQKKVREEIKRTADELRRAEQEAKKATGQSGRPGGSVPGILGGAGGAYAGAYGAKTSFFNAVNMDESTRFQRAVGGISEKQQVPLTEQAFRIGQETKYTNQDVVEAQTRIIQAGVRDVDTVAALTEAVKNYSLAMRVTMEEGSDTVVSVLQQTQKDISNPKTAKKVADAMVNFIVDMAKRGGMGDSDIGMFFKYGGASGKAAGMSDSTLGSMAVQFRRGGLRGEEAGVFARAASGKLVSPTQKGQAALNAMGLEYADYASMPDVLSADNLEKKFKRDFGKNLTKDQKAKLADLLETGTYMDQKTGEEMPISADQGAFTAAVSEVLSGSFKKNKNGEMAAADANKLASKLGEFYRLSVESVDVERLLMDIMKSDPTLAQLNAMFTERQGGRAAILADRWSQFEADKKGLENVPSDRAKKIGDEVHAGMYGSYMELVGAVETMFTKIGQDWEGLITPLMDGASHLIDSVSNLPQTFRMVATAATAAAVALGGIAATRGIAGLLGLGGVGAGAAATGGGSFLGGLFGGALAGGTKALGSTAGLGLAGYAGAQYILSKMFPSDENDVKGERPGQYGNAMYPARTYSGGEGDVRPMPGVQGATSALDVLKAKAIDTGRTAQEALNFTATPTVNASSLDSFIAKTRAAQAGLNALGGGGPRVQGGQSNARPMPGTQSRPAIMSHRAAGGPVAKGHTYIVGEKGPEPVTFGSNGYVTPNRKAFGGSIGNVTFNITSSDPMTAAREIERTLTSILSRSQELAIDGRAI